MVKILLAGLFLILATGYLAAITGISTKPGYADISFANNFEATPVIRFSLGPLIIKPAHCLLNLFVADIDTQYESLEKVTKVAAAKTQESINPEQIALHLLDKLQAVRIAVYEVDGDIIPLAMHFKIAIDTLAADGWEMAVSVNGTDEQIVVMTKMSDSSINGEINNTQASLQGVLILVSNANELVLLNAMGYIEPSDLNVVAAFLAQGKADKINQNIGRLF